MGTEYGLLLGYGLGSLTTASILIPISLVVCKWFSWKCSGLTAENAELRGWATSMEIAQGVENMLGEEGPEEEIEGEDYNGG